MTEIENSNNSFSQRDSENIYFVGKGGYGCVYRPRLPCANAKKEEYLRSKGTNMVGKLFEKDIDLQDEIEAQESFVHKIDPESKFTVKHYDSCRIDDTSLNNFSMHQLLKCKYYNKRKMDVHYQLILEDGGIDFSTLAKRKSFFFIFEKLRPLFEGIVAMDKKGLIHNDIKPANIVYNEKTDRTLFIDFGLINTYDDIFSRNFYHFVWRLSPYYIYPPEYRLFARFYGKNREGNRNYPFFDITPTNENTFDDNFTAVLKKQFSNNFFDRLRLFKNIQSRFHIFQRRIKTSHRILGIIEYKKYVEKHFVELKMANKFENPDNIIQNRRILKEIFAVNANKICVYALGVSLYLTFLASLKDTLFDIKTKNAKGIHLNLFFDLFESMIHSNPNLRSTPQQALVKYDSILDKLKKK